MATPVLPLPTSGSYHAIPSTDSVLLNADEESESPLIRRETTTAELNLDVFLKKVYQYFRFKGWKPILTSRISNIVMVGFTIFFTAFLFLFVNWGPILSCQSSECVNETTLVRPNAMSDLSFMQVVVLVFETVFVLYWMWDVFRLFVSTRDALWMRKFFAENLGLDDGDLLTIRWHQVVDRLIAYQHLTEGVIADGKDDVRETDSKDTEDGGRRKFEIPSIVSRGPGRLSVVKPLDALDITQRILRTDNFLVAMFHENLLDLSLHIPWGDRPVAAPPSAQSPGFDIQFPLTQLMEWNLYYIVASMFDTHCSIRKTYVASRRTLQSRFILLALLNAIASPFLLVFLIVNFVFRYTEEFRSSPSSLGARKWSPRTQWAFREFNELPHAFEARMFQSHGPAVRYLGRFPMPISSMLARMLIYILGGLSAAIIIASLWNEYILVGFTIFGRPLVFVIAVFGGVLAVSRKFVAEQESTIRVNAEQAMQEVARYTHHFPRKWNGRCHTLSVKDEFVELYPYRLKLFLNELFSVVFTPILLGFALPQKAGDIVSFIDRVRMSVPGLGDVCGLANFAIPDDEMQSHEEKMKTSLLTFMANQPTWDVHLRRNASAFLHDLPEISKKSGMKDFQIGSNGVEDDDPLLVTSRYIDIFHRHVGIGSKGSVDPHDPRDPKEGRDDGAGIGMREDEEESMISMVTTPTTPAAGPMTPAGSRKRQSSSHLVDM
eukprot:TRINITY_DN24589_c0_g1_i1.p1 TRINITY_DN24589_c0_g1~~TRINITY_DN24589_c0_g1_i1.p1  ORF type:complete len:718 (-),score=188.67 TRINITY_DN24589_c0_g1_i1:165-2318(-)